MTAKRFLLKVRKHPESKYGAVFPNSKNMLRTTEWLA